MNYCWSKAGRCQKLSTKNLFQAEILKIFQFYLVMFLVL